MDPGHGRGVSWVDFQRATAREERPSYFPNAPAEPAQVVRLNARKGDGLDDVPPDRLGLHDVYILENAVEEGFPSAWFMRLLSECGSEEVQYWHQRFYFEGRTTLTSIVQRIHLASSHRCGVMMMDEDIIRKAGLLEELQAHLPGALHPSSDLFQQWPRSMQPAKQCLIMGGTGGCSTLHTDMLGWTGWNLLLMGRKHWKFFAPAPEVGEALGAEVREMGGQFNLGFSCTSAVDMYHLINGEAEQAGITFGPDASRFPRAAALQPLLEVVQGPGELIVFPAHYFHQTYHHEPTIVGTNEDGARCGPGAGLAWQRPHVLGAHVGRCSAHRAHNAESSNARAGAAVAEASHVATGVRPAGGVTMGE